MRAYSFASAATMLLALLSNSVAAQDPIGTPDAAAEIRAKEDALAEAIHTRNRLQLEQLLAPDYVLRGAPDIDRATWLQNALTLCWGDQSDINVFRARQHDVGDDAVAEGDEEGGADEFCEVRTKFLHELMQSDCVDSDNHVVAAALRAACARPTGTWLQHRAKGRC